jgi:peptidyl-prolyl cis-trans isomerase SurA
MRTWAIPLVLASSFAAVSARSETLLVERVVARVDGRPILLSDVRRRSRPFLLRIATESLTIRAVQTRRIHQSVLDLLIDENIIERVGTQRDIEITDGEVNASLERIAADNDLDVRGLLADVRLEGLTDAEYREYIRREMLRGRLEGNEEGRKALTSAREAACIERMLRF